MNIHKYIKDFLKNEKKEDIKIVRDIKINDLIKHKDLNKYEVYNYLFYINEKLGYNSSLVRFIDIIIEKIENRIDDIFNFDLDIDQLSIDKIEININDKETFIKKENSTLKLNIEYDRLGDLRTTINHELHHIFINIKGNKTNDKYFIINDLIQKTSGKTHAFLILYYLSFKDEINSNIQMFHSIIADNNIKNKDQFLKFLHNYDLYNVAIKMKNIDILTYWSEISKEGNCKLLIDELNIKNISEFLKKTNDFIINSGDTYIRKLSKSFL